MRAQKLNLDELYPDDPLPRNTVRLEIVPGRSLRELNVGPGFSPADAALKGRRYIKPSRISAAWLALRMMLMVLGGVVSIAYVAALPRVLQYAAVATAALIFLLLYGMIRKYQHGR
jgi:hypothetical protein